MRVRSAVWEKKLNDKFGQGQRGTVFDALCLSLSPHFINFIYNLFVTLRERAWHIPSPPLYADESRVSVVIQGCVCLVRSSLPLSMLPVQATLTVIYLQLRAHTHRIDGRCFNGRRDRLSSLILQFEQNLCLELE